jgi:hypothetical protein
LPKAGAKSEKIAKVIKLQVVRNPANPLEIPKSSRIKGIKGPTEAIEVLRLIEINTMLVMSKAWLEDLDIWIEAALEVFLKIRLKLEILVEGFRTGSKSLL